MINVHQLERNLIANKNVNHERSWQ